MLFKPNEELAGEEITIEGLTVKCYFSPFWVISHSKQSKRTWFKINVSDGVNNYCDTFETMDSTTPEDLKNVVIRRGHNCCLLKPFTISEDIIKHITNNFVQAKIGREERIKLNKNLELLGNDIFQKINQLVPIDEFLDICEYSEAVILLYAAYKGICVDWTETVYDSYHDQDNPIATLLYKNEQWTVKTIHDAADWHYVETNEYCHGINGAIISDYDSEIGVRYSLIAPNYINIVDNNIVNNNGIMTIKNSQTGENFTITNSNEFSLHSFHQLLENSEIQIS